MGETGQGKAGRARDRARLGEGNEGKGAGAPVSSVQARATVVFV